MSELARSTAITCALISPDLLNQAEAALQRKLAENPHDARALRGLGDLQRRRGEFGAALKTYRVLQHLRCDAMTNWLVAVASGERLPWPAPEGVRPSPFIRIKNFLDAAQQERLLAMTHADPETFVPARIYSDKKCQLRRERRNALRADRSVIREIRRWFAPKLQCLVPRLAAHFHNGEPGKRFIEVDVTAHLTGGFFEPHSDDSTDSADPLLGTREISYAYYFHQEPRRFDGGDLLLYDTCPESGGFRRTVCSRIEPVGNTIVFFPSGCYHEILPVACHSNAFQDGRFTVNGWIHKAGVAPFRPDPHAETQGASGQVE